MSRIQCKHCQRSTASPADIARSLGWRMFTGKSLTGKDIDDVVCPWCAGTALEPEPSWRVRCNTCSWEYEDDEDDEEPLDAKAAYQVAHDHECEPWVEVQPPADDRWISRTRMRRDGSFLDDERVKEFAAAVTPP